MGNRVKIFTLNDPHALRICKELAEEIGFNESVVLLQLEYLIGISTTKTVDNDIWTRQSAANLKEEHFPWWSVTTISRAIKNLADGKKDQYPPLIKIGNFNKFKYDRTQWIALDAEGIAQLKSIRIDEAIMENQKTKRNKGSDKSILQNEKWIVQNDKSIPQNDNSIYQNNATIPQTPTKTTNKNPIKDKLPLLKDPPTPPEPQPEKQVVVVGADSHHWPIDKIGETADQKLIFKNKTEAEHFIGHWLYAKNQRSLNAPVFYALKKLKENPPTKYLEIVKAGPSIITEFRQNGLPGNNELVMLRQNDVHINLIDWMPELDPPQPEPQPEPEPEPQPEPGPPQDDSIDLRWNGNMTPRKAWDSTIRQIEMEIPKAAFETWVSDLVLISADHDRGLFKIQARNQITANWITDRLQTTIERLLVGIMNQGGISFEMVT